MNIAARFMNFWRKLNQDNSLKCGALYLPRVKSLGSIYERYGARSFGLVDSSSLDIGAGGNLRNPFECKSLYGIDVVSDSNRGIVGADLVLDPIPFADNSFNYITAYDFLEHVPRVIYSPSRRMPFVELMNEIFHVLKPGGIFLSHTPIYPCASAFRDPTHVNILTVETFPLYFDDVNKWGSIYGFSGAFKILHQAIKEPHLISVLQKVKLKPC